VADEELRLVRYHYHRATCTVESRENGHFVAILQSPDGRLVKFGSAYDGVYGGYKPILDLIRKGYRLVLVGSCFAWSWTWRIALSFTDPMWDNIGEENPVGPAGNLYPLTYWGYSWKVHVRDDGHWRKETQKEIVCIDDHTRSYDRGNIPSLWSMLERLEKLSRRRGDQ